MGRYRVVRGLSENESTGDEPTSQANLEIRIERAVETDVANRTRERERREIFKLAPSLVTAAVSVLSALVALLSSAFDVVVGGAWSQLGWSLFIIPLALVPVYSVVLLRGHRRKRNVGQVYTVADIDDANLRQMFQSLNEQQLEFTHLLSARRDSGLS